MTKNTNYTIDFISASIVVTKKFYKAASILNSPEYKELMQLRHDNPGFSIVLREIKKKDGKKTYRNLTYENMKTFIESYVKREGVGLEHHEGDRAFYRPATDSITLPLLKQFKETAEYYTSYMFR